MSKIYLLPYLQYIENKSNLDEFPTDSISFSELFGQKEILFFINARKGIHYLMEKYNLQRQDEVCIMTTTDSSFVTTCVTSTIFNYCKVSRIITEKTKMIFVIHEFGFSNKFIKAIVQIGEEKNIPVVEDVAHSLDSFHKEKRLGLIADYGIYSLPKIFPVKSGGILIGRKLSKNNYHFDQIINDSIKKDFLNFLPFLKSFTKKRRSNYKYLEEKFKQYQTIFSLDNKINPFIFGFFNTKYQTIYDKILNSLSGIELHPCYVKNWVIIPVNQFLTHAQLDFIKDKITSIINNSWVLKQQSEEIIQE